MSPSSWTFLVKMSPTLSYCCYLILWLPVLVYCLPPRPLSSGHSSKRDAPEAPVASQGWTSSPDGRGTLDILWSCLLTVFLCGWTIICVNVPPLGATKVQNFRQKVLVFCEALAGPEFIVHTSLGQYMSARKSVQEFSDAGFVGWTTRHGFFADMGGFVLHAPDFVPFPLTASQLHYLVVRGYVDFGDVLLTHSEIEDKNKFDALTRILTMLQLSWFVINTLARTVLGKAISTLELSTLGFIFCTLFTYFFWRQKPQDVSCPIIIRPKVPLADILVQAGPVAARPYSHTPLDFATRRDHHFGTVWRYTINLAKYFGFHWHQDATKRPIQKIWDDQFLDVPIWAHIPLAFAQFGFAGIHLAAWNFHFPSLGERFMWRLCSVYIICAIATTWVMMIWMFVVWPWAVRRLVESPRPGTNPSIASRAYAGWISSKPCRLLRQISNKVCNNSTNKDPKETIPLLAPITVIPLGVLYVFARMYTILEDVINLRDLPSSAYDSVQWSDFLPHF